MSNADIAGLELLPELPSGIGQMERDGKAVLMADRVLWREDHEPFGYVDASGVRWEVGWLVVPQFEI